MEEKVLLKIETKDEIIEIPFLDLECLDLFTVRYKNKDELINALSDMLDLGIDKNNDLKIYVYYQYYSRDNKLKEKTGLVKYQNDDFNIPFLEYAFKEFLYEDHERVKQFGVKKIRSKAMIGFLNGENDLTNYDINYAVHRYLDGARYRTYRKIYFAIRESVKITKNRKKDNLQNTKHDFSKGTSDDEYISYLLELTSKSDVERDRAIEELSLYDLDRLNSLLDSSKGLFDGMGKNYSVKDLYDLETYTGTSVENLSKYLDNNRNSGYKK